MNTEKLTPEKSLDLISRVINEARNSFEENGFIYMFWGILIALASAAQYILLRNEYVNINYYPYFILPLGGIYTWYYYSKKKQGKLNQIGRLISGTWIILGLNMVVLGFFFGSELRQNLIPVILILLSVAIVISGISINSLLLIIAGILINVSSYVGFSLEWIHHPLLMSVVSVVAILIPGIILMINHKRKINV